MAKTKYIKYKAGYKYQLYEVYKDHISIRPEVDIVTRYILLSVTGELEIRYGYAWDGASGPTIDTLNSMRGSLVHDALCQLMRMDLLDRKWKTKIDLLFEEILIVDDMSKCRARVWFRGVDKLADSATLAENVKEVITAPARKQTKFLEGVNDAPD